MKHGPKFPKHSLPEVIEFVKQIARASKKAEMIKLIQATEGLQDLAATLPFLPPSKDCWTYLLQFTPDKPYRAYDGMALFMGVVDYVFYDNDFYFEYDHKNFTDRGVSHCAINGSRLAAKYCFCLGCRTNRSNHYMYISKKRRAKRGY